MFVVKFMGGLGNQLLQLNFCNYLKEKYPEVEIRCDISSYKQDNNNSLINSIHGGFLIQKLQFDIIDNIEWKNYLVIKYGDNIPKLNPKLNYYLEGYWPLKLPFKKYFDFDDVFKISNISNSNKEIEKTILSYGHKSVAIHIRCGDYNNLFNLGNVATKSYYNNAIDYISKIIPDAFFFVFSNDINWAKNNLYKKNNIFYVESNNEKDEAIWDIYLMSKCSNFIISNSSFSLWAQFFNTNEKKIVLTPEYWTNVKTTYSNDGTSAFQKFPYMKSIKNIPIQNNINQRLLFFIRTNNNFLSLRRFITAVLNQNSNTIKIYVSSNNKKIKQMVQLYNQINKCVELIKPNCISKLSKKADYYSIINLKYYMLQETLEQLYEELDEYSENQKIYIPTIQQPNGTIISEINKKYPLPVIYSNLSKNKNIKVLSNPFFCYVPDKKKEVSFIYLKNFIKSIINMFYKNNLE